MLRRSFPRPLVSSIAALLTVAAGHAATFTYTPTSATDVWSAGTNWSATPVSAQTTELTFTAANATVLPNALVNVSNDDIAGQFLLNILNLQGTGPASGAGTITIGTTGAASGLVLASNGATTPVVNLNALNGVAGLTYNISPTVTLNNNTLFQGAGTVVFNFNGGLAGSAITLTKTGASTLTLGGSSTLANLTIGSNTTGGTIKVASGGSLSIGSGSGSSISIGGNTYRRQSGTLDASLCSSLPPMSAFPNRRLHGDSANFAGTLNLGVSNTITAATSFTVGSSNNSAGTGTRSVTTAVDSTTTLKTPILDIGVSKATANFTAGAGSTLNLSGVASGARTALTLGNNGLSTGGAFTSLGDFTGGGTAVLNAALSSLPSAISAPARPIPAASPVRCCSVRAPATTSISAVRAMSWLSVGSRHPPARASPRAR